MPTIKIGRYQVMYSANTFHPRLWLRDDDGVGIGQLIFMPNGSELPPDTEREDGSFDVFYHQEEFSHCLDLLRNDGPVFLLFSGSGGGFENGIQTTERVLSAEVLS